MLGSRTKMLFSCIYAIFTKILFKSAGTLFIKCCRIYSHLNIDSMPISKLKMQTVQSLLGSKSIVESVVCINSTLNC